MYLIDVLITSCWTGLTGTYLLTDHPASCLIPSNSSPIQTKKVILQKLKSDHSSLLLIAIYRKGVGIGLPLNIMRPQGHRERPGESPCGVRTEMCLESTFSLSPVSVTDRAHKVKPNKVFLNNWKTQKTQWFLKRWKILSCKIKYKHMVQVVSS